MSQRNHRTPRQVRRIDDLARVIIAVRRADTDSLYLVLGLVGLHDTHYPFMQLCYIVVEIDVFFCLDGVTGHHMATGIDYSEHRVGAPYIDSYYIRFAHCFCFLII